MEIYYLIRDIKNDPRIGVVNICVESDEELWRDLVNEHKLQGINLLANKEMSKLIEKDLPYGQEGLPLSLIVTKDHRILGIDILEHDTARVITAFALKNALKNVPSKESYALFMNRIKKMNHGKKDEGQKEFEDFLNDFLAKKE